MCVCVCVFTSYDEGGLGNDLRPTEATADTFVGPCVPGFDLCDQQRAVGEQEHSVERKDISSFINMFRLTEQQTMHQILLVEPTHVTEMYECKCTHQISLKCPLQITLSFCFGLLGTDEGDALPNRTMSESQKT